MATPSSAPPPMVTTSSAPPPSFAPPPPCALSSPPPRRPVHQTHPQRKEVAVGHGEQGRRQGQRKPRPKDRRERPPRHEKQSLGNLFAIFGTVMVGMMYLCPRPGLNLKSMFILG
ncbi:unnamed protein product [Urochloa humidicola]